MSENSTGIGPYEAVLADLRRKRDHLESLISGIENICAGGATVFVGPLPVGGASPPAAEGPGTYLGMSIVDATKKLLAIKRQPLKVPDILAALKAGGLALSSKEPGNVIGSVLTRHFNEVGEIVRVERGLWGLKEWYPNRSFAKKDVKPENAEKDPAENKPDIPTGSSIPPMPPKNYHWRELKAQRDAKKASETSET